MLDCISVQHHEDSDLFTYAFTNSNGMVVKVINAGCTIQSILVPDRLGHMDDVVMGYDDAMTYITNRKYYFGCILGRCASRIRNGDLVIDDRHYQLTQNAGRDHLHGGFYGFDRVVFKPEIISRDKGESLELTYVSPDGEEGYPGEFRVKVTYTLTDDNRFILDYTGTSDADTAVNLSNHSFFNLAGHGSGQVLDHQLMIQADDYTVADEAGIPTGEIRSVAETPLDFRSMIPIGKHIRQDFDQITQSGGYNTNYAIEGHGLRKMATLYEPESGRMMDVSSTMPGLQLFTANRLDGTGHGKDGARYDRWCAVCLETQYYPDACHHPQFVSPVLRAGEQYHHQTVYHFSCS